MSNFTNLPFSAAAIAPRSSDTTITMASDSSVNPNAALCLVPISGVIISLSVKGKIHPAASTNVFCKIIAPSCKGDSGWKIDNNNPEDVDTDAEDHAYDALRYGVMSRPMNPNSGVGFLQKEKDPKFQPADSVFGY